MGRFDRPREQRAPLLLLLLAVCLPASVASLRLSSYGAWREKSTAMIVHRVYLGAITMKGSAKRRKEMAAMDAWEREFDALNRAPTAAPVSAPSKPQQPFPYLCVCDFEATCEEDISFHDYTHEIIEFPVVVIDLTDGAVLGEFHSYVRPTANSTLSPFCTGLTGITQRQVDTAPTLPEVLSQFEQWRLERDLVYIGDTIPAESTLAVAANFAFAADGAWDLRYFLHGECTRKGIPRAAYFDKWCNLKALFAEAYHRPHCAIEAMLQAQGMAFEGRPHSGIDDTRNLARVAARMREDGHVIHVNEAIPKAMRSGGALAGRTRPFSKFEQA